jgi:hypothetical protein
VEGLLEQFKDDLYDEKEATEIAERLSPGRLKRFEDGLPHGGGNGPNYGYKSGERRVIGKSERPMGVLNWKIDEEKAKWVRWMFDWVDEHPPAEVSLRGMARELDRKGVLSPTGGREWAATQVRSILRNAKYCGKARGRRYRLTWETERDRESGMVHEVPQPHDLLREAERVAMENPDQAEAARAAYEANTHPILPTAVPPIVTVEQWKRVQEKLKAAAALNNRGAPRRTDAEANSTLLDGGYIRCAECGGKMSRHWETKSIHPYYRCYTSADRPSHPHIGFHVSAHAVDALVPHLLAKALTDPEKILELASAAEGKWAEANADAQLAASALAAYHKRIAEITAEHDARRAALAQLRGATGTDTIVAEIEAQLAQLDRDREEAEQDRERAIPHSNHAQARAAFLRDLFTTREKVVDLTPEKAGQVTEAGEPYLKIGWDTRLPLHQAAALLGVAEEEVDLPIERGEPVGYWADDDTWVQEDIGHDTALTEDVICCLLRRKSRDELRTLLHRLDGVVKVKRGRTRAEIDAGVKKPPLADRVYLELLGTVQIRTDVTKLKTSS